VNLLGFLSLSQSLSLWIDQKGCEWNKQLATKQNHFSVHKQSAICSLGQPKNTMLHSSLMDVIFQQLPRPPAPPSSAQPQHPVPNELSEELRISQTWVPSIPYIVRTSPSFDTNSIIFRNVDIFTPNFYFFRIFLFLKEKIKESDKILENLISFVEMESFKINQLLGKHVLKWPRHYYIIT
jgi:hypothetical protein